MYSMKRKKNRWAVGVATITMGRGEVVARGDLGAKGELVSIKVGVRGYATTVGTSARCMNEFQPTLSVHFRCF